MPLFLPQLSRREFLKRAALAGTAVALAPQSHAGLFGKARDRHTFAFFSDTHVAADAALQHGGVNMADNLAACVRELAAWPVKPAAVIVNGDLAFKSGLPEDYATFGKLIELKSVPQKQAAVFSSDRANWFLLDSLAVTDTAPGEVGPAQFTWLSRELDLRPAKPAIVVCHHNLQMPGSTTGLKDSAAMEDLFARHPQVKAFVFGHTHNWHVETHASGVHLINLPQTSYPFKAGRPSGWVRCSLARDGAAFELRALDPKHPEHAQGKTLSWRAG